jgi:hypothetical protein
METNWAAENLQTIRTLMERSAVYRRALAPIMLFAGLLGVLAAGGGIVFHLDSTRAFGGLWLGTALVAIAGAFLIARRQALRDHESFWSPPTKRVAQALLPPLMVGLILGIVIMACNMPDEQPMSKVVGMLCLPLGWVVLYGCALCAAGFFTPGGLKIFGWAFIVGGCGLFALGIPDWPPRLYYAHSIMGFFFGVLHLAYGAYLYLTEKRKNAA